MSANAYTSDELRAAYAACVARAERRAYPSRWPATYEAAMADAVFSRLVSLEVCSTRIRARGQHIVRTTHAHYTAARARPLPAGYIDIKRAAAGDRD